MLLAGKKKITFRGCSFFVKENSKNKFESYADTKFETFIYCRYYKGELVAFVHVYECPMSGIENIKSEIGNTNSIYKYFQLTTTKARNYIRMH